MLKKKKRKKKKKQVNYFQTLNVYYIKFMEVKIFT